MRLGETLLSRGWLFEPELASALGTAVTVDDVCKVALREAVSAFGARSAGICLPSPGLGGWRIARRHQIEDLSPDEERLPLIWSEVPEDLAETVSWTVNEVPNAVVGQQVTPGVTVTVVGRRRLSVGRRRARTVRRLSPRGRWALEPLPGVVERDNALKANGQPPMGDLSAALVPG